MTTTTPSEAGHWYDSKTGEPRYTIVGKNGKERPTTLRDARKLNLVPSVTTITRVMDKPGLTRYLQRQMFDATATTARREGEADNDYFTRCLAWANEHKEKAAARGTALHGDVEKYLAGKPHDLGNVDAEIVKQLTGIGVDLHGGKAEHSFAHPDRFGGKVDWHSQFHLLDFKTKDRIEDGKQLAWDEHAMQLAAYRHGLGIGSARCYNVFVGIEDGKVVLIEQDEDALRRGLAMFRHCLALWQLSNKYP